MQRLRSYAGVLKDSLYWWISKKKKFNINDEYEIELLYINKKDLTAKLKITNLQPDRTIKEVNDND
jgi:hypothetical protein